MIQLMEHQRYGVELARTNHRHGFGYEPGLGKSALILAIVAEQGGKTVVVCPKSILWTAWFDDAEKFYPQLKVVVCWSDSPAKRKKLIASPADILVMNYETFKKHQEDLLAAGVTRLVVDESSKLRNEKSQISQAAFSFSQKVSSVYLLSGTPAPNNNTEYFGQVRCLDSTVFGTNFWRFANYFFVPQKRMIQGKERIIGWRDNLQRKDEFLQRLGKVWTTKRAEDCLDLPGETDEVRQVDMTDDEFHVYLDLLQELKHEFSDGQITQVSANARTMKLRQVTGGSLYIAERQAKIVGDSKLSAVREILEEIGDRQAVIWCSFRSEIDRLMEEFSDAGRIDGSISADDRTAAIRSFQSGGKRLMICHPAAAGHGITLTAARFNIFYSLDFMPENHEQARRRIYRTGQHWPVVHYYLISRNSIDEKVYRVLRGKMQASDAIKELLSAGRAPAVAV